MAPTLSQPAAGYVDKAPGIERCETCSMFRKPTSCTLVKGTIKPGGWCRHWRHKGLHDAWRQTARNKR